MNEMEVCGQIAANFICALQSGLASHTIKCCLQVERQIDQMVSFIKQEAEEKANEISVSAEEV